MNMKGNPMRLRSSLARGLRARFIAVLVFLTAVAAARAGEQTINRLDRIEVQETDTATRIVVNGSEPPTFTVFKLTDPLRLFVDVSNAQLTGLEGPVEIDNGVVGEISTLQFKDELVSVGRLVIGLEVDALYTVKATANQLVIQVDARHRKTRRPSVVSADEAALRRRAEAAEARARTAEAQRASALADLRTLEEERRQTRDRIAAMERSQRDLAQQVEAARAEKDATLAGRLEAEQRARNAELAAQRARMSQIDSAERVSKLTQELRGLQGRLEEARRLDRTSEVARLQGDLKRLDSEKTRLRLALENTAEEARKAQTLAEQARVAAEEQTVALRHAEARADAAETARQQAEAELARLDRERQTSLSRIGQLEATARALGDQLATARAEKDATRAERLQVEQRARQAELASEKAQVAQLDSARKVSEMAERARKLQESLDAARGNDQTETVVTLQRQVDQLATAQRALESTLAGKTEEARIAKASAQTAIAKAQSAAAASEARARAAEARAERADASRRQAEAERAALEADRQRALGRVAGLDRALVEMKARLGQARAAQDTDRTARLEAEQRARRAELAAEQAQVAQIDSAKLVSELRSRMQTIQVSLAEARGRDKTDEVRRMQAEVDQLKTKEAELVAALEAREHEVRAARERAVAERTLAERATRESVARATAAEQRAKAAESAHQQAERRLGELESQRQAALTRIAALESNQSRLADQLDQARVANDGAKTARLEAEERARAAELTAEQARVAQLESAKQASQMRARVQDLQANLDDAKRHDKTAEVARLQGEVDRLALHEQRLQAALKQREAESQVARRRADAEQALVQAAARESDAKAHAAEQRARAAEAARREAEARLAGLEAQRREALSLIAALEGNQTQLSRDLEQARANQNAARTAQLESEQRAHAAELSSQRAQVARLESAKQAAELSGEVDAAQALLAEARARDHTHEIARLQVEVQRLEGRAAELNVALSEKDREALAANQLAAAEREKAKKLSTASKVKLRQAEARAQAAEHARAQAVAELALLSRQRQQAQGRVATLESARKRLIDELAQARAENNAARAAQLESEQRAQDAELSAQRAQIERLDSAKALSTTQTRLRATEEALGQARKRDRTADVERLTNELAQLSERTEALQTALRRKEQDARLADERAKTTREAAVQVADNQSRAAADVMPTPPAPKTRVVDVRFEDRPQGTYVHVNVEGPAVYDVRSEGALTRILELRNAQIDPALERSLDTGEFPSAVRLVSSFQAPPPGDNVRVVVTLGEKVADRVTLDGNRMTWSFAKPSTPVPAARSVAALPAAPSWAGPATSSSRPIPFETRRAAPYSNRARSLATNRRQRAKPKTFRGRKISIDIKDADIHNILRLLAKEGKVNIITSDRVKGAVTLHLKLVPWDQVLDIVLHAKGLDAVYEGDIIRVAPAEDIAAERKAELERSEVVQKLKPLEVKLITVNHAMAADLLPRVKSILSSRGTSAYDERTNTVIVKDIDDHLAAAEDLIRRLDTQTPQVLIESRIVEVNSVDQYQLGIQWGGDALMSPATGNPTGLRFPSVIGIQGGADDPQAPVEGTAVNPNFVVNLPASAGRGAGGVLGLTFGSIGGTANLNVRLSALENRGSVKIVSSPKITTLDNKQAIISQGVSIPIAQVSAAGVNTVFFDAVLRLTVTPHVTQDGNIYLRLRAENNTPDFQNVGARGDPTILKKEAQTELLLNDGDTTVIGGIYTRNAGFSKSEVPVFGRIPILGALFRSHNESDRRTELLIFVTPRIVNRAAASVRTTP